MQAIRNKAIDIIQTLPSNKLSFVLDYLTYLKEKDDWKATQELLDNKILSEINEGIKQLKNGNYIDLKSIRRNV